MSTYRSFDIPTGVAADRVLRHALVKRAELESSPIDLGQVGPSLMEPLLE